MLYYQSGLESRPCCEYRACVHVIAILQSDGLFTNSRRLPLLGFRIFFSPKKTYFHLSLYYLINVVCPALSNSLPALLRRRDSVLIILYRVGATTPTFSIELQAKHLRYREN